MLWTPNPTEMIRAQSLVVHGMNGIRDGMIVAIVPERLPHRIAPIQCAADHCCGVANAPVQTGNAFLAGQIEIAVSNRDRGSIHTADAGRG